MYFVSKLPLERYLGPTYSAVCALLRQSANALRTGCLTIDGWSAALGAPILGITWNFIDEYWRQKFLPLTTLNRGTASKSGKQFRFIVQEILNSNTIVSSDGLSVHTVTSDTEPAVALAVDFLTNYVGHVRCVFHTLALCVNEFFGTGPPCKWYMDHVNKFTKYFNYNQKAKEFFLHKQLSSGVTQDFLHVLKHDIPTRWHSLLIAMLKHIMEIEHISADVNELGISHDGVPPMTEEQQNTLAEIINVLAEFCRIARQLEADKRVTMSRFPRLLR